MPLAIGNFWVRIQSLQDSTGQVIFSELDSIAIIAIDSVGGEAWYKTSNWYYYMGRTDGLWWSKQLSESPKQLYKYPVTAGDAYDRIDEYGKTSHYRVLATDAEVSVPAGTFTCWQFHVLCPSCDIEDTVWIAPDIGDVRSVAVLPDGSKHVRELLRYTLIQ